MEMLVSKFSKGKYRNEGELFSEPISKDNVKLMGEMIAFLSFVLCPFFRANFIFGGQEFAGKKDKWYCSNTACIACRR